MAGSCRAGVVLLTGLVVGTACGDDGSGMAWEPPGTTTTADDSGDSFDATDDGTADTAEGSGGEACAPGEVEPCLCPDGLSLGEQTCDDDGQGFGTCMCEGDSADGSTGESMPPLPAEICYLGGDGMGNACIPLGAFYAELPLGYEYPPAMAGDGQDRPPIGLVDIEAVDPGMSLAPNFALDELAQTTVGRWAVVQPHAVERLQAMRDVAGSIGVLTGYLSPAVNEERGGELYARHLYGDGFDLEPYDTGLTQLADLCVAQGGEAVQFADHIHCQFSAVPLDEDFFGPPPSAGPPGAGMLAGLDAWIERDGRWLWAPSVGFTEGEPRREWSARNEAGEVIATDEGVEFAVPPEAVEVSVRVGGRFERTLALR